MADLLFIEEGNPTYLEADLFNFEKLEMVAKVVVAFEQLKLYSPLAPLLLFPSLSPFSSSSFYITWGPVVEPYQRE